MAIEKSILVIDDDELCLSVLSEFLDGDQYHVATFSRATCLMTIKAAERCPMKTPCYDVLITDNQMPGMTGLDFLALQQRCGCKIPDHRKAIISGNWCNENLGKAEQLGCQVFDKPYAFDQISNWLEVSAFA